MPNEKEWEEMLKDVGEWIRSWHWSEAPGILRLLSGLTVGIIWITVMFVMCFLIMMHMILVWSFATKKEWNEWKCH